MWTRTETGAPMSEELVQLVSMLENSNDIELHAIEGALRRAITNGGHSERIANSLHYMADAVRELRLADEAEQPHDGSDLASYELDE